MMGIKDGFVKLIARKGQRHGHRRRDRRPRASELIYPIAIAVERRLTVDQVSRVFAVYPSLSGSITDATHGRCTSSIISDLRRGSPSPADPDPVGASDHGVASRVAKRGRRGVS